MQGKMPRIAGFRKIATPWETILAPPASSLLHSGKVVRLSKCSMTVQDLITKLKRGLVTTASAAALHHPSRLAASGLARKPS